MPARLPLDFHCPGMSAAIERCAGNLNCGMTGNPEVDRTFGGPEVGFLEISSDQNAERCPFAFVGAGLATKVQFGGQIRQPFPAACFQ